VSYVDSIFIDRAARIALRDDVVPLLGRCFDLGADRWKSKTCLYFASAGPVIKVGNSWKPRLRVCTLAERGTRRRNGWCGLQAPRLDLVVLGMDYRHERVFHRAFAEDRCWGEWYPRCGVVGLVLEELLRVSFPASGFCDAITLEDAMRAVTSDRPWGRRPRRRICPTCGASGHSRCLTQEAA